VFGPRGHDLIEVRQIAKLHRRPAGFNPSMASLTFRKLPLVAVGIGSRVFIRSARRRL
jgi:hypothetical protein